MAVAIGTVFVALVASACAPQDAIPRRDASIVKDVRAGDGSVVDSRSRDLESADRRAGEWTSRDAAVPDAAPRDLAPRDATRPDGAAPDAALPDAPSSDTASRRDTVAADGGPGDVAVARDASVPGDGPRRDAGVLPDRSLPPTQAELCTSTGWCWISPTPPVGNNDEAIVALAPSEIYVSKRIETTAPENSWLLRYDGSWKLERWMTTDQITDAFGHSQKIFLAERQGRVHTYDGTTFTTTAVGSGLLQLFGFSSTDVFLLGGASVCDYTSYPYQCAGQTFAVHHYDGSSWKGVPGTLGQGVGYLGGSSATDLWGGGTANGELRHFDGASWSTVQVPTSDGFGPIWGRTGTDVFAVGFRGPLTPTRLWRYQGSQWSPTTIEGIDRFRPLSSAESIVFGGLGGTSGTGIFDGKSIRWISPPSPVPPLSTTWGTSSSNLYALARGGDYFSGPYRFDGSKWTHLRWGVTTADLFAIRARSRNSIFALSSKGTLVYYDGTRWAAMPSGYVAPAGQLWVDLRLNDAGPGAIVFWPNSVTSPGNDIGVADGFSVRKLPPTNKIIYAVWGSSPTDIYAAGDSGLILHFDGTAWTQLAPNYGDYFRGITGFGPKEVYFLSYNRIVRFDGQTWSTLQPPRGQSNLTAICSSGTNNLVVVGDNGTMLVFDGTSWSSRTFASPPSGTGPSFCITQGPNDIWWGGRHYPNDIPTWPSWRPETAFYPVGNEIFAVGRAGTIVHRKLP